MVKQVALYSVTFILFSFIGYYLHTKGLSEMANQSPISLVEIYLYHGLFSFLLSTLFSFLSNTEKFRDQLGFLYLFSVSLKIIIFCFVFYDSIFRADSFTNIESANLLIPMGLFLIIEVFFISKTLNNISPLKNDK